MEYTAKEDLCENARTYARTVIKKTLKDQLPDIQISWSVIIVPDLKLTLFTFYLQVSIRNPCLSIPVT